MLKTTELAKGFRLGVVAMFALGIVLTELQWPEHRHRLTPETFLPRLSFRGERQRQGQKNKKIIVKKDVHVKNVYVNKGHGKNL